MDQNAVILAVAKVGGPTKAAHLLGVSNQAVHKWCAAGRMPTDTELARARVRLLADRSGVRLLDLLGFVAIEGGQHPDGRRRARSSRCLAPLASPADTAAAEPTGDAPADAQARAWADDAAHAFPLSSPVETRAAA